MKYFLIHGSFQIISKTYDKLYPADDWSSANRTLYSKNQTTLNGWPEKELPLAIRGVAPILCFGVIDYSDLQKLPYTNIHGRNPFSGNPTVETAYQQLYSKLENTKYRDKILVFKPRDGTQITDDDLFNTNIPKV